MGQGQPGTVRLVTGMRRPRALISTIEPVDGGVPTMTRCIASMLEELGIEPVFAWYAPWSAHPDLSLPLHTLPTALSRGRRPGSIASECYGGHEGHGIGAWLPELEFTHYLPRRTWRELIASCTHHLSVTGNPLCALPYARLGIPFLAWVATPWQADRVDRVRRFSPPRRLLDRVVNTPVLRQLERQVLRAPGGRILALSAYTASCLEGIADRPIEGVLLMPVDTTLFRPLRQRQTPWRIGFSGRYGDPRKNVDLLLQTVRLLMDTGHPVQLELVGEPDARLLDDRLASLGITNRVHCHPHLQPRELARVLQGLDLFVIPSHQEGLCIAALEAMACGVPVVSTRCGGPEEFVLEGRTGELVEPAPEAMARAIVGICSNRDLKASLGEGALTWVREHASPETARAIFRRELEALVETDGRGLVGAGLREGWN